MGGEGEQPHHGDDPLHGVAAVDVTEGLLPVRTVDLDTEQLDQHQPRQGHQHYLAGQPLGSSLAKTRLIMSASLLVTSAANR